MKLLICGDRNWTDKSLIGNEIDNLPERPTLIIEGGARGADLLGRECAEDRGILVNEYAANWGEFGKAAGPIRNQQMIDEGKPDMVLAFHDNLHKSKGTKDMVNRCRKLGIRVKVVYHCHIEESNEQKHGFKIG